MAKPNHKLTKHHRKPTSIGGTNDPSNISHVPDFQHRAWHTLVSNHSAKTICQIINEKWLDDDFVFICIPTEKYEQVRKLLKELT